MKITTQSVIKNEENWIWFSLMSVKDYVSEMLIIDDSSTDKTLEVIKSIKDPKIKLFEKKLLTPKDHTNARNELIEKTTTDWFLLVDGDEVWNKKTLEDFFAFLSKQPKDIYAVGMRTRNCVGDIYHYLPEDAGQYKILDKRGHLTIRAYRKLPGFKWLGVYPLEKYCDAKGQSVNDMPSHLAFFDGFYWHMTHLTRSSATGRVKGWRTKKLETGIRVASDRELPEVLTDTAPNFVPSPWTKRSLIEESVSRVLTPLKKIRRSYAK